MNVDIDVVDLDPVRLRPALGNETKLGGNDRRSLRSERDDPRADRRRTRANDEGILRQRSRADADLDEAAGLLFGRTSERSTAFRPARLGHGSGLRAR